jgi:hypothetical protein
MSKYDTVRWQEKEKYNNQQSDGQWLGQRRGEVIAIINAASKKALTML